MNDPADGQQPPQTRHGALFVGRLSTEKGVHLLMEAWREIDYPLSIVGDGPLRAELQGRAPGNVTFHGQLDHDECLKLMTQSAFLVFPSIWYEGFGLSLLESFAVGIPVIAFDLGPRSQMVIDGYNGFLCPPRDLSALRDRVVRLIGGCELREKMGRNARDFYLAHYTPELNYKKLLEIYDAAVNRTRPNHER
jgi:glycosyltransferase involved in cell wall biosynthesis